MSHAAVVRYTTRPDTADENEQLIKAVFTQLAEQLPEGLRYIAIRLDDGVSCASWCSLPTAVAPHM